MENYYQTLGISREATPEEIRLAYRILARRYHPDVNPGKQSEEQFKGIAAAYKVLSDPQKRKEYDDKVNRSEPKQTNPRPQFRAYQQQQERYAAYRRSNRKREAMRRKDVRAPRQPASSVSVSLVEFWEKVKGIATPSPLPTRRGRKSASVSVVEISITIKEAIYGVVKTVEIMGDSAPRAISVKIPPAVRTGSVVHLRSKGNAGEEIVAIVRVMAHQAISITPKGVIAEIPISVNEAISGASISVPTLDEAVVIRIPAGTQSGDEVRLVGRGAPTREGKKGDLFIRFLVKVPESANAVGLRERALEIDQYYGQSPRQSLKGTLLE